ncbi:uncharacterized protein PHALS_10442 [Plasmopara halstedii]|uniref:Uncharacterized protein n=1 Tax=Plasmopara halstedii TaxID=4781 RepID=A0A0P1AGH4_PLAHL|nr:uncharacterized protein PHALS_10442 [Plasmopara halstedii]CEG40230.1 hypothetical protein PHALS_10442 [Plasmopara halstedii]|eukprot:XP_024576599.1 hypothetical protein PHALS_10442 [Plasmopara halstedii]
MDAILSRVGDAELRQHCVAAVLDELLQTDKQVKDVVLALERTLKVVQASRNVHKSLILNASDQVQASFRQLGESCNKIGPLLRLLHHNMSAASTSSIQQLPKVTSVVAQVEPKATPTDSASTTTSEYECLSDDSDVVVVTTSKRSKKRKAAVDLSGSARKKILLDDTESVRKQLTVDLRNIRATCKSNYTVGMHKDLSSFLNSIFEKKKFHNYEPRDDPVLAQLLDEMDNRNNGFKESTIQIERRKKIKTWQNKMTALSFASSLDLISLPVTTDPQATDVHKCKENQDIRALSRQCNQVASKLRNDHASVTNKRKKYMKDLVDASIKYFAAVLEISHTENQTNDAIQCMWNFHMVCELVQSTTITRGECVHLEKVLYLLRLVMAKINKVRKRAIKCNIIADVLALFPPSVRPEFKYPPERKKNKKKDKK